MKSEDEAASLQATVAELLKQLQKKQTFESAASALSTLIQDHYAEASPAQQNSMYAAVCRAATLLTTRFTAVAFWIVGLQLFESAAAVVTRPEEKKKIHGYIKQASEVVGEQTEREDAVPPSMQAGTSSQGFLFEGQLTVSAEPPPPQWLQSQNLFRSLLQDHLQQMAERVAAGAASEQGNEDSGGQGRTVQQLTGELQSIMETMNARVAGWNVPMSDEFVGLEEAIQATLQEIGSIPRGPPPASKEEIARLPIVEVTQTFLENMGEGAQCAVCQDAMVVGDKLQEMPCKHNFHPDCLKPWLDEHNSCPICRHEMRTDDHEYEQKKERDREDEEERKGAANALRGGEFMYI